MSEEEIYSARHWAAKAAASAQAAAQSAQNSSGLAIGQLVWGQSALATENPGCLSLWTGEYIANASTLYPDFYAWVKSHPELCKTKAEYDELVNTAQGCLFYVVDEVEGSLRLPKYKLGGRVLVDSKQPTATSPSWYNLYSDGWLEQGGVSSGTFNMASVHNLLIPFADTNYSILGQALDANDCSVTWCARKTSFTTTSFTGEGFRGTTGNYGYNTLRWEAKGYAAGTLMENIKYPWVCAYNAAIPASTAQAAEFQQALTGKANADLSNCPTEYDYVVGSGVLEDGSWYRKYKSGWLEQGGPANTNATVTFPKPFATAPASLLVASTNTVSAYCVKPANISATSFVCWQYQGYYLPTYWYACGQGAEEE